MGYWKWSQVHIAFGILINIKECQKVDIKYKIVFNVATLDVQRARCVSRHEIDTINNDGQETIPTAAAATSSK